MANNVTQTIDNKTYAIAIFSTNFHLRSFYFIWFGLSYLSRAIVTYMIAIILWDVEIISNKMYNILAKRWKIVWRWWSGPPLTMLFNGAGGSSCALALGASGCSSFPFFLRFNDDGRGFELGIRPVELNIIINTHTERWRRTGTLVKKLLLTYILYWIDVTLYFITINWSTEALHCLCKLNKITKMMEISSVLVFLCEKRASVIKNTPKWSSVNPLLHNTSNNIK